MQGRERNTRDPSAPPSSRQGPAHKATPKSQLAQRESEGAVVLTSVARAPLTNVATNNAAGGKGPCGGHVDEAGKGEGMADSIGPNQPPAHSRVDKVRQLQRRLWAAAKRAPGRRFHALYDRIYRDDILWVAWERVKGNRGAAGVDAQTLADVEQYGVPRFLGELQADLRAKKYRPRAVRRKYIEKEGGKQRPLGIPTVQDRVVQMAAKLVLEPIYEADFGPTSYGFRPRRSAQQALERLRQLGNAGCEHVLDADIENYLDRMPYCPRLMKPLQRAAVDGPTP